MVAQDTTESKDADDVSKNSNDEASSNDAQTTSDVIKIAPTDAQNKIDVINIGTADDENTCDVIEVKEQTNLHRQVISIVADRVAADVNEGDDGAGDHDDNFELDSLEVGFHQHDRDESGEHLPSKSAARRKISDSLTNPEFGRVSRR